MHQLLLKQLEQHEIEVKNLSVATINLLNSISLSYCKFEKRVDLKTSRINKLLNSCIILKKQKADFFNDIKMLRLKHKELLLDIYNQSLKANLFLDSIPDPVLLLNADFCIVGVNSSASEIFGGREKKNVVSTPVEAFLPDFQPDGNVSITKFRKYCRETKQKNRLQKEWIFLDFQGVRFRVELHLSKLVLKGQKLILAKLVDISAKESMENLLKTQEQYKIILKYSEKIPGAIYQLQSSKNQNFSILFASPGIVPIFELSIDQIMADPIGCLERIDKNDLDDLHRNCRRAFRSSSIWDYKFRVNLPIKGIRWLSGSAKPELLPDRSVVWNGYLNDITDKKEAEALLMKTEARFKDIFENTDEMIHNIRIADKKILYVNPAWNKNLGYSNSELEMLRIEDILDEPTKEILLLLTEKVTIGRHVQQLESVFKSKSGNRIYVHGRVDCHYEDDKPYSIRGIFRNITESRKASELIHIEKELSNTIINNLPGIFFLYDHNGKMLRWNKNFEYLNDYSTNQVEKLPAFHFFDEPSQQFLKKLDESAPGARLSGAEVIMVTRNGTKMYLAINSALIQYEGNSCRLVMGIDISKRKQAEVLLIETNKELEKNNEVLISAQIALDKKAEELEAISRYKTEFLANMSHELRTPLNSIMILSRILFENKYGRLSEKEIEYAEVIQKSGYDLLHLINDVLDLAKVESGKLEMNIRMHSLFYFLRDIKATWMPMAVEKGIKFRIVVESGIASPIYTDIDRIGQVIRNLLSNAFKFTNVGGRITLKVASITDADSSCRAIVEKSRRVIQFQVKDTGIGIPKEKQEMVFLAFQQADGTTRRKYGGTGLGLSISRDIVRQLGGEIIVKSQVGKGSCFIVCLPV